MIKVVTVAEEDVGGPYGFATMEEATAFAGGFELGGGSYGAGHCSGYIEGSEDLAELYEDEYYATLAKEIRERFLREVIS